MGMALLLFCGVESESMAAPRTLPHPLPGHPGNIFVLGEELTVPVPSSQAEKWQVLDQDGNKLTEVTASAGQAALGKMGIGFYRLRRADDPASFWISAAVVAPLKEPTPSTSPIGLDVAMAWFYPPDKMESAASLCALAGVNWVRDRLSWPQLEAQRGKFAPPNQYDAAVEAQRKFHLRILEVNHMSPPWANPDGKRFPLDLRDAYHFYEEIAKRWKDKVQAFEPWNEADIPMFGGHTGSEMATFQKAAFLGLKDGDPAVIACLNVFALHQPEQLRDLQANDVWPYFDTFNLHHYAPIRDYPALYADFRAVSAGKPLWVTEFALPVHWTGDERLKEPSDEDLRVQAQRVVKSFAASLYQGTAVNFYFLLPHYAEGQTQFGLLRPDLTPRPAYLALAAVGRWLADAKPIGQLRVEGNPLHGYWFQAMPDGAERDVLVAWADKDSPKAFPNMKASVVYDYLGRPILKPGTLEEVLAARPFPGAPILAVFPKGEAKRFDLAPPPAPPVLLAGNPSPVVIQAVWPAERIDLKPSAYRLSAPANEHLPLYVYNFGPQTVKGTLKAVLPPGWKPNSFEVLELPSLSRTGLTLELEPPSAATNQTHTIRLEGDFGDAGKPILSFRVKVAPAAGK